jgi:uncharacterized protein (TIGR01244 family)
MSNDHDGMLRRYETIDARHARGYIKITGSSREQPMDIRQVNDEYSVTGQISPADLDEIKAMGFKSIVCHRPDYEQPDQPEFAEVAARADELGLTIAHIPVGGTGVTADAVRMMVDALDEFPRPMLGYCRSGARSTVIYQQTQHIRG